MRRFVGLCLLGFLCSLSVGAKTYTIYVNNQTGWAAFDLYAWGDYEAFGGWPGATYAPVTTVGGVMYNTYTYTAADGAKTMLLNLIFHNNVGENQPGDRRQLISLYEPRDYYLFVSNASIYEVTPSAEQTDGALQVDNTSPVSADNRVIYELNLYDFTTAGTLAAAQQRLGELRRLGIDIIWLMPIYPRGVAGRIGTLGSPYAPRDFKAVNQDHGSLQNLKDFVSAAHALDMSVWLDWVPNHTAIDHTWVSTHPDYYERVNGVIQHPSDYGDVYQLNYSSAALRSEMTNAMRYWVNEADIDGFRCDYASSSKIGLNYWKQAIQDVQTNNRNKRVEMLAEADFTDWNASSLLSAGFDYDYAWGYADGLKSVGTGTSVSGARTAANNLLNAINSSYSAMSRMSYITNHDDIGSSFSSNYLTVLGSNVAPMTVMYFTFFGMPLLYNGQEIGQTKILNYFNRNTIDWNTVNKKIHNTVRTLVALKHTMPALADGKSANRASTRMLNTNNNAVLAYEKSKNGNTVLVVISLSDRTETVTLSGLTPGLCAKVLDSKTVASGCTGQNVQLTTSPTLTLDPKGYQIYTNTPLPSTTALEHITQEPTANSQKLLLNGQLLILRDGRTYTIQGLRL